MAKKKRRETQELESLIPSIKSAEKSLDDLLEGARSEAADLIQAAESEAAQRIQKSREEMPGLLARERESRMVALQAKAVDVLEAAREANGRAEKEAAGKVGAAAALIVSRVWPEVPR
jgi:vacuolar-type H+-ATPase subunit H